MKRERSYRAPWQMSRNVAQVVHNAAFERSIVARVVHNAAFESRNVAQVVHNAAFERSIEQMSRTNISYFRAKKKRPAETETPVGRTENISLI